MSASNRRSLLLDTNIIIAVFAGYQDLKWQIAYDVQYSIPCIVVGELIYGAHVSSDVKSNLKEIEAFIDSMTIVGCDSETAIHFGKLKSELRKRRKLIPDNDIWIAGIALQNRLTLITRDPHFKAVPDLTVEEW